MRSTVTSISSKPDMPPVQSARVPTSSRMPPLNVQNGLQTLGGTLSMPIPSGFSSPGRYTSGSLRTPMGSVAAPLPKSMSSLQPQPAVQVGTVQGSTLSYPTTSTSLRVSGVPRQPMLGPNRITTPTVTPTVPSSTVKTKAFAANLQTQARPAPTLEDRTRVGSGQTSFGARNSQSPRIGIAKSTSEIVLKDAVQSSSRVTPQSPVVNNTLGATPPITQSVFPIVTPPSAMDLSRAKDQTREDSPVDYARESPTGCIDCGPLPVAFNSLDRTTAFEEYAAKKKVASTTLFTTPLDDSVVAPASGPPSPTQRLQLPSEGQPLSPATRQRLQRATTRLQLGSKPNTIAVSAEKPKDSVPSTIDTAALTKPLLADSQACVEAKKPARFGKVQACVRRLTTLGRLCALALILISVYSGLLTFSVYMPMRSVQSTLANIDGTLRLGVDSTYCIVAKGTSANSPVLLGKCQSTTSERQSFDLDDGTIRLKAYPKLCVSAIDATNLRLTTCAGMPGQKWKFQVGGSIELDGTGTCVHVIDGDVSVGKLSLYGCDHDGSETFTFGGNQFLATSLWQDVEYVYKQWSTTIGDWRIWHTMWLACIVASCFVFVKVLCTCEQGKLNKFLDLVAVGCICVALSLEYQSLGKLHSAMAETTKSRQANTLTGLDYSLRMSSFPETCLTSMGAAPSAMLSMEKCKSGNRSQQFLIQDMVDKQVVQLKSNPNLCIGIGKGNHESDAILVNCEESAVFQASFGSGGNLQLATNDAETPRCLKFGSRNGEDAQFGKLGFFECGKALLPAKGQCGSYGTHSSRCSWTNMFNCPGQKPGAKGAAGNDGTLNYICCCQHQYWKAMTQGTTVSQVFVYSQGTASIAKLMQHAHAVFGPMDTSRDTLSNLLCRMALIFLGTCVPALWLVRNSDSQLSEKKAPFDSTPEDICIGA